MRFVASLIALASLSACEGPGLTDKQRAQVDDVARDSAKASVADQDRELQEKVDKLEERENATVAEMARLDTKESALAHDADNLGNTVDHNAKAFNQHIHSRVGE